MNFLNKFRRLHWKLALSYTLVSGTLFGGVTLLGFLAFFFLFQGESGLQGAIHDRLIAALPEQTTHYFEGNSPDVAGLEQWLDGILAGDVITVRNKGGSQVTFENVQYTAVLDADGNLLAVEPANAREMVEGETAVSAILSNIHANTTDSAQLRQFDETNNLFLWAIPIYADTSGELQGVIFIKGEGFIDAGSVTVPVFQDIIMMVLAVLLTAFGVAAISSYFAARGLAKRLARLSVSTEAWAQGDFSSTIQDNSQDEIGQLAHQLNRMAEQLQNLLHTRSDLAALEERNRLARDLHDSVKQQVFATVMQLGAAKTLIDQEPQAAKIHLAEGDALARQVQLELTGLIHELRPINMGEKGFVDGVREYVMNWSTRTKVQATVQADAELTVPATVAQELFRVLQEALSNIARHSQAKKVTVSISQQAEELLFTIEDDGQGFKLNGKQSGVGLFSMRERVEGLNGRFHIQTQPGKGTILTATVSSKQ